MPVLPVMPCVITRVFLSMRMLISGLTPCEGGREPKASGGFGFRRWVGSGKRKPPARLARLPPSQGGRKPRSFLFPLLRFLFQNWFFLFYDNLLLRRLGLLPRDRRDHLLRRIRHVVSR